MAAAGRKYDPLTSWRGICALAVALFHFPVLGPVKSFPLVSHAYLCVDFFFVLSGFVIATVYEDRLTTNAVRLIFAVRRFGRLWPLHATILFVFVLASAAKHQIGIDERHSVLAIFTNLALLQGLGIHHELTWNGSAWSISVEATLYLLCALLSCLPRRRVIYAVLAAVGWGCWHRGRRGEWRRRSISASFAGSSASSPARC
jgi:peptidoglycan/LPS O-acetylase OafA/YrhL